MTKWSFLSFLQLFWKKWEFRNFFVQIESPSVAVYFSKKIKTCSHASQMRLKAKKSQFSSVLTWFVRCKNFFLFFVRFFSSSDIALREISFFHKKLNFFSNPPLHSMFKNMRIWWFDENVDIVHLETIPKKSENVFSWAPKWSKKSGLDGILVQMGPKIPQNELSKTHASPLSKSFRHKITILSSSVFDLTDFFYFEKMQVISCDL